jgi:hypothetical protein
MKRSLIALLVVGIAGAIGYVFGTEAGRRQRDALIARLRPTSGPDNVEELAVDVVEANEDVDVGALT